MNRVISFTDEGHIRVESELATDVISRGGVLLTLEQAKMAKLHGWEMDEQPFTKETTPWLYSVWKGEVMDFFKADRIKGARAARR